LRQLRFVMAGATVVAGLVWAAPAAATTQSFTAAGCSVWNAPADVVSVQVEAVGSAGAPSFFAGAPSDLFHPGGDGDQVNAEISGLTAGEPLDVCVDVGAGSTGTGGGGGGGASGVAVGSDFTVPEVVAAGGGGGGYGVAASAGAAAGASATASSTGAGGGTGGTLTGPGGGGAGTGGGATGGGGAATTAAGPGAGGVGANDVWPAGGGGGGYTGGGGGGADNDQHREGGGGGGGGGSDFCSPAASVSGCAITPGAGTTSGSEASGGAAEVVLSYTVVATPPPTPPPATPVKPADSSPPTVSGTATAGKTLSCSTGTWSGTPTGYMHQWSRDGTPLVGANSATYKVVPLDQGTTLTCTVTATNSAGSASATSKGVAVRVPVVAGCPAATGTLAGTRLGSIRLGITAAQARHDYRHSSNRGQQYEDFFCLTPIGIRVGLASPTLLKTLPASERTRYAAHVVWASTSNPRYAIDGVRAGATLASAAKHLKLGKVLPVGLNDWYLAPAGSATAVLKVRHGIVEEVGIAVRALTRTRTQQRRFMTSFQ
jgi:hypothetical protein